MINPVVIQVTAFITLGKSGEGPGSKSEMCKLDPGPGRPADRGHGGFGNWLVLWGLEIRFNLR